MSILWLLMLSGFFKGGYPPLLLCALILFFASKSKGFAGEGNIQAGRIIVEVSGLRNNTGEIVASLYNSRDGFPFSPKKAFIAIAGKIEAGESRVVFEGIPFGRYAVSVFHDESGNKKMDMSWLMVPREGVGASNNPKSLGPPSFDDAGFKFDTDELILKIRIRYY